MRVNDPKQDAVLGDHHGRDKDTEAQKRKVNDQDTPQGYLAPSRGCMLYSSITVINREPYPYPPELYSASVSPDSTLDIKGSLVLIPMSHSMVSPTSAPFEKKGPTSLLSPLCLFSYRETAWHLPLGHQPVEIMTV